MMKIKQVEFAEIPAGVEEFYLLRMDSSLQVILETYQFDKNKGWDNKVIREFGSINFDDEEEVLERVKNILPRNSTLYIEEGTLLKEFH